MAQSWLHSARTVARSPGLSASSQVQSVRNRAMGCGGGREGRELRACPKASGSLGETLSSPSREFAGLESKSSEGRSGLGPRLPGRCGFERPRDVSDDLPVPRLAQSPRARGCAEHLAL